MDSDNGFIGNPSQGIGLPDSPLTFFFSFFDMLINRNYKYWFWIFGNDQWANFRLNSGNAECFFDLLYFTVILTLIVFDPFL